MDRVQDRILRQVSVSPGITDRWLAEALFGLGATQQRVNGQCRYLAGCGKIIRRQRPDGLLGNFLPSSNDIAVLSPPTPKHAAAQARQPIQIVSEDHVKRHLEQWLQISGWVVRVSWAKTRGVDLIAVRNGQRWLIEAKGEGSLDPMRVNYFLCILGELLQRMDDPKAKYSVALPDIPQFRKLWARLPVLAKQRTRISALFIRRDGSVEEMD